MFDCMVACENAWRDANCVPEYPTLFCENPYPCPTCPGAWSCADIENIVEDMMTADLNDDGLINLADVDPEHL